MADEDKKQAVALNSEPRRRKWLFLLPLAVFMLISTGLAAALFRGSDDASKFKRHEGDTIPMVRIGDFDPSSMRGSAYVVNFFASWCAPCVAEHAEFKKMAENGVPVVGIAYKDSPEAVRRFLDKRGNPFAVIGYDSDGRGGIEWGLTGVPETFLVGRDGTILLHRVGQMDAANTLHAIGLWRKAGEK